MNLETLKIFIWHVSDMTLPKPRTGKGKPLETMSEHNSFLSELWPHKTKLFQLPCIPWGAVHVLSQANAYHSAVPSALFWFCSF